MVCEVLTSLLGVWVSDTLPGHVTFGFHPFADGAVAGHRPHGYGIGQIIVGLAPFNDTAGIARDGRMIGTVFGVGCMQAEAEL